jgi:hypothetical protein
VKSWNRSINKRMETKNPNIAFFISRILDCEELDFIKKYRDKGGLIIKCLFIGIINRCL